MKLLFRKEHGVLAKWSDWEGYHPALEVIHVKDGMAEATDGIALLMMKMGKDDHNNGSDESDGDVSGVNEARIPRAAFARAMSGLKSGVLELSERDGLLVLSQQIDYGTVEITTNQTAEAYPDTSRHHRNNKRGRDDSTYILGLGVPVLSRVLEVAKVLNSKYIRFQIDIKELAPTPVRVDFALSAGQTDESTIAIIMPANID